MVVLLALAGAGALWASSAVPWVEQRYRTPFSGTTTATVDGSMLRQELVPVALAALAAIAAVLATGGLLRRLVGLLVVAAGGLLIWRSMSGSDFGWFVNGEGVPSGSVPVGVPAVNQAGPLLMTAGGVVLLCAGALVLFRANRMPAMGAKYSAPADAKRSSQDPDTRLWDALDAGDDPTDDQQR